MERVGTPETVRLDYGETGLDFEIPAAARGRTRVVLTSTVRSVGRAGSR